MVCFSDSSVGRAFRESRLKNRMDWLIGGLKMWALPWWSPGGGRTQGPGHLESRLEISIDMYQKTLSPRSHIGIFFFSRRCFYTASRFHIYYACTWMIYIFIVLFEMTKMFCLAWNGSWFLKSMASLKTLKWGKLGRMKEYHSAHMID